MSLCLTIFGVGLMLAAPAFIPQPVLVGFIVALVGVILAIAGK